MRVVVRCTLNPLPHQIIVDARANGTGFEPTLLIPIVTAVQVARVNAVVTRRTELSLSAAAKSYASSTSAGSHARYNLGTWFTLVRGHG